MINDVSNDPAMCSRLKFCQSTPQWHSDDIAHQDDRHKPCSEMEYKPHAEICQRIPSKNMLSQICLNILSQKLGYFDRFEFTQVVLTTLDDFQSLCRQSPPLVTASELFSGSCRLILFVNRETAKLSISLWRPALWCMLALSLQGSFCNFDVKKMENRNKCP